MNTLHFTDMDANTIQLGDVVSVEKSKTRSLRQRQFVFVFCIPQHRYGFMDVEDYEWRRAANELGDFGFNREPERYVLDWPDLDFYWTPKNAKTFRRLQQHVYDSEGCRVEYLRST
jgi:hypothetical protein